MRHSFKWIALQLSISAIAFGANIAVVDSGVDYKHQDLKANMWKHSGAVTDADGKSYSDVQYGWNFAENNNQVIDYKYLGTFSADCTKIFEVQAKILGGTATQADKDWYTAKKADAAFVKELGKFGNFVHGTHVSGISSHEAHDSTIIALKIIPTETPGGMAEMVDTFLSSNAGADNPIAKMFLQMAAKKQGDMLKTFGKFVAASKAEVANGSFGTSVKAVIPAIAPLLTQLLGKEPTEEEKVAYARYFVEQILESSKDFVGSANDTLFVFAAGNDGTNNDSEPVSPANLKFENTIAVAATNGYSALASFSNFGASKVEVAAPGVAILSTIPGDMKLAMSGTSMAAPFVTNVAGLVKDTNKGLSAKGIKAILMQTVDVKPFLAGKVSTGGIVNKARAVQAARLSLSMPLANAIRLAREQVRDVEDRGMPSNGERDLLVLPLPSWF